MSALQIVLAGFFFLLAVTAAVAPFTGPQRPKIPDFPPGFFEPKVRPGDIVHGTLKGSPSINGLRKLNFIRAQLHFKEGLPLDVPVTTKAASDDWDDKIEVDTRYETAPLTVLFDAGPLPDDPRMPGASPTLTVTADVMFPAKVDDKHFEPRSESPREITSVTFFAAGEFEKREAAQKQAETERVRIVAEFKRQYARRQTLWWSAAVGCAILGAGVLAWPISPRRSHGD